MIKYSDPVIGKDFFAREDIFSDLQKSAQSVKQGYRQNIALIGSGLIGKSSVLLNFLSSLTDDKDILPIYLDIKSASLKEFIVNFIDSSFYHAVKQYLASGEETDKTVIVKNSQKFFPKSTDLANRVLALIDSNSTDDAFSCVWDIPSLLSLESGRSVVVVVDEFNCISSFPVKKPYQILGQKIMVQQKTLFILSSSAAVTAKKILSEKLFLLFGGFKVIDIGPFNPSEAGDFIDKKSKAISIQKTVKDFMIAFTGGHPFYLSSIIAKINFAVEFGADKITFKRLSSILSELLFSAGGVINQFFCDMLAGIHEVVPEIGVLDALRSFINAGSFSDISGRGTMPSAELACLIGRLLEFGLVEKSGSMYAITDPVFRMWIQVKSKSRNLCFDFMPNLELRDYETEIESRIASFKSDGLKSLDDRLKELICCFNNNHFFIDERVRVLPKVENIALQAVNDHNILTAQAGKKKYFFIVSRKTVNEEDVAGLQSSIKSLKTIKPKVVLITPFGIEPAAKLLAKQKHFLLWNREDVVRLLYFYKGYNTLIA
jgi:hypothetical protein